MPDRAIIPLLPALSLGFICGIIASALLVGDGGVVAIAVAGSIATALAAGSSVFGVKGDTGEKAIVAGLRILTAIGLFLALYVFILGFLRDGSVASVLWLPVIIALAILLTRFRVRDRGEVREAAS
jgi:hypothetical protein